MDARIRQFISKAAGTYFVVTDKSQVPNIEADAKMRLFFINVEKGPINSLLTFAKGDDAGFTAIYGKSTRLQEKKGNFSISVCLDAIKGGPIAVVNLRAFDNTIDKAGVVGLNPNIQIPETLTVGYTELFNKNTFWAPKAETIRELTTEQHLLNFGNVGNVNASIIVTLAKDITSLTSEGNKTLKDCSFEIDEYPAINFETLVKDVFVDVYVFNNTFGAGASTNKYYGHLFNTAGNVDVTRLSELTAIPESGYKKKFTGCLIPNVLSGTTELSIDTIINQGFMETGIICNINDDLFENDNQLLIDTYGVNFFEDGVKVADTSDYLLSYVVPGLLTTSAAVYPLTDKAENVIPVDANEIVYGCEILPAEPNSFLGSFEQGLRVGDVLKSANGTTAKISKIDILQSDAIIGVTTDTYTKIKVTCDGLPTFTNIVALDSTAEVTKVITFTENCLVKPFGLSAYSPRIAQFTDGSATRQSAILDMMLSPGIVKGIKNTKNIRYIVDCFKSFAEADYKYQFGNLTDTLDKGNKFVRSIINEPFIDDLEKSTNPLFKQIPGGSFDINQLLTGGNKTYSTKFLSKFNLGADLCFWFGPGDIKRSVVKPISGLISNLFYQKKLAFDVLANETGYIDGITELETAFDDDDRAVLEAIGYNAIINLNGGNTIFGNLTGQKAKTAQQQIHNSELLAFIKENLFNLSKTESFKKGNYEDYLRTEVESTNFMNSLALAGAIEPNPVVICNASNNTQEIAKNKIKLVHIEYTPIDALDKVVFDLQIN